MKFGLAGVYFLCVPFRLYVIAGLAASNGRQTSRFILIFDEFHGFAWCAVVFCTINRLYLINLQPTMCKTRLKDVFKGLLGEKNKLGAIARSFHTVSGFDSDMSTKEKLTDLRCRQFSLYFFRALAHNAESITDRLSDLAMTDRSWRAAPVVRQITALFGER